MQVNQIIFIQAGAQGETQVRLLLQPYGLDQNVDFMIFSEPSPAMFEEIKPDLPQLIFTSHGGKCNAGSVAERIKAKNPRAIVCAFTSFDIEGPVQGLLDGVIRKYEVNEKEFAKTLHQFRVEPDREKTIARIKEMLV